MPREIVKMLSTGKTQKGRATGTFYTTKKNKKKSNEKLKFKRYDSRAYNAETGKCGQHVLFEETKV